MKKICKLRSLETSYKNQVELFFLVLLTQDKMKT